MSFTILSVAGIVVYVLGVPAIILGILVYNRKHLHDESSPKHADVKYAIGGIYLQYEPALCSTIINSAFSFNVNIYILQVY